MLARHVEESWWSLKLANMQPHFLTTFTLDSGDCAGNQCSVDVAYDCDLNSQYNEAVIWVDMKYLIADGLLVYSILISRTGNFLHYKFTKESQTIKLPGKHCLSTSIFASVANIITTPADMPEKTMTPAATAPPRLTT